MFGALTSPCLSSSEPSWTAVNAAKINICPTVEKFREDLTEVSSMLINSFAREDYACVCICTCTYIHIHFEKENCTHLRIVFTDWNKSERDISLSCLRLYFFGEERFSQDVGYLLRTVDTRPIRTDGHHKEGCHRESRSVGCFL